MKANSNQANTTASVNISAPAAKLKIQPGIPKIGIRSYLSGSMLRSAIRFTALAQAIEDEHPGMWQSPHAEEHQDYVIAAVLCSYLFLEATINELYSDVAEKSNSKNGYVSPLSDKCKDLMAAWWEETDGRGPVMSKYQLMLSFDGQAKIEPSEIMYQSVESLRQLRNILVHYKPETIFSDETHRLEKRLKGKYPENGLIGGIGNWWPNRGLSAGCAKWAYESAKQFVDEVSERLRIEPNYKKLGM